MRKFKLMLNSILFVMIAIGVSSFTVGENPKVAVDSLDSSWKLYTSVEGVEIYQKLSDCHDDVNGLCYKVILLKFNNTNSNDVTVDFNRALWEGVQQVDAGASIENKATITIPASKSVEGTCTVNRKLQVYVQDLVHDDVKRILTHYAITNIVVRK